MRALPRIIIVIWTLALLAGGSASLASAAGYHQPLSQVGPGDTPVPIGPVITTTQGSDGAIVHIVQPGETLITIASAYGVKLSELRSLNSLSSDSIFAGDKLIIRLGATATVTSTATQTATSTRRPTSTHRPPTATPTITRAPTITPTATNPSAFTVAARSINNQTVGIGVIVVCAIGLIVVGLTFFRTK